MFYKTVFAIQHIETKAWMPARMFRSYHGGWSQWTPNPPEGLLGLDGFDKNPRIFFSKRAAINAVSSWVLGVWQREFISYEDVDYGKVSIEIIPARPPVPRKRFDLEIVEMILTEPVK